MRITDQERTIIKAISGRGKAQSLTAQDIADKTSLDLTAVQMSLTRLDGAYSVHRTADFGQSRWWAWSNPREIERNSA